MIFVDVRSPKPLYEQIKDSIRSQILHGLLLRDDKLPSVRELAQQNAINPNTIQKAYRDLEAEGLLYSLPGRGCFVAAPIDALKEKHKQELLGQLLALVAALQKLGVSQEEILQTMKGGTQP